jgi:uncharacterized DUF497 family protein
VATEIQISYDPAKRDRTLLERELDFEDAAQVFGGPTLTLELEDTRLAYGERRFQTYGLLRGRLVMVVWTLRGTARHIISMRKCNEREKKKFAARLGGP